ncbi:MAG: hypothetical protein ABIA93_04640, partial [Candidatus Woesearchaeota archaeon]
MSDVHWTDILAGFIYIVLVVYTDTENSPFGFILFYEFKSCDVVISGEFSGLKIQSERWIFK